jgi:hypothetical protein
MAATTLKSWNHGEDAMNRNLCTFAGIVLFTLMMAGRAEAQFDCGEFCHPEGSCSQSCTNGHNWSTCLSIGRCNFDCWTTCEAGVPCWQYCLDNGTPTTCGEMPLVCDSELASNTRTQTAANAEQCVASSNAPAGEAVGQTRADVNRRRSDDVVDLSGR